MNEITVNKREWIISEVRPRGKDGDELANKFDKNKSVFRQFREESEELLRKMFELDFSSSKMTRIIRNNDEELLKVKNLLWLNYNKIKNIYL